MREPTAQVSRQNPVDGSRAEGTITFGLEGKRYEIDLSKKNAAALRKALAPYIESARSVRVASVRGARRGVAIRGSSGRSDLDAIRMWARDNGHQVADRGRISSAVIEAYDAAH